MKTLFISFFLFSIIICQQVTDYSNEFYYQIRINDKFDAFFLLDTSLSESYFFTDSNKINYNLILNHLNDEIFNANIEINGLYIKDYKFILTPDFTKLDNIQIQGIIGLGLNNNNENVLVDSLKKENIIKNRIIYYQTNPEPKIMFPVEIKRKDMKNFTSCEVVYNEDYPENWICKMTNFFFKDSVKNENNLNLDEFIDLDENYAIFDSKSYYITAPEQYINYFLKKFNQIKANACTTTKLDSEKYLSCSFTEDDLTILPSIVFVFDGYGYKIRGENLFMNMEKGKYISLIKFNNKISNDVWIFGFPLFNSYLIKFDFDNLIVGFNGEEPFNLTSYYNENDMHKEKNKENKIIKILKNLWNNKKSRYSILGILGTIILCLIIFLIYRFINRNNKGDMKKLIEEIPQFNE